MKGKRKGTYSRIYLHFVWSTKNRAAVMDAELREAVIRVFASKAKEMGFEIIEANGPGDHVHVLLRMPPSLSPSEIAKELKGSSSYYVNHVASENESSSTLYWQDGYGVVSVSPSALTSVRGYVRNQVEHHRDNRVLADYELS